MACCVLQFYGNLCEECVFSDGIIYIASIPGKWDTSKKNYASKVTSNAAQMNGCQLLANPVKR